MSTVVTLNGIPYSIPVTGEVGWGQEVHNYLVALSTGVLSLEGGNFTLQSDLNFGPNFGVLAPYFKSGQPNPASSGVLRLTNTEGVAWRNSINTADLVLTVSGDNLLFNGQPIGGGGTQSPLIAKGDIYTFTNINARLPVGLNGQVLMADSSTITGLTWGLGGGGGGGSVVGFTFIDANGVHGIVGTPTTTPNLTISLGDIVPTSVVASGIVTGSNIIGTNTGDQTITLTGAVTGSGTGSFATTYNGVVPINKGGTGQITANLGFNALAPSQVGQSGKFLFSDGFNTSWQAGGGGGGGGVVSVSASGLQGVTTNVTNPTSIPNIEIGLGNITPTSVAATGTVTGSNISGTITGTNTGDQTITLSGDVTGAGTGSINAILANTPVVPGSYTIANITVDSKGRITSASAGSAVTTLSINGLNGVTTSVTSPTTAPSITVGLGNITPLSVVAAGTITGTNLSGTNTGNQTITAVGDASGVSSGSPATMLPLTLANTGVIPGIYTAPTIDVKGRVTFGNNLTLTGDATGTASSSNLVLTLTNTGVVAGTYEFATITVDTKGRVTSANAGNPTIILQNSKSSNYTLVASDAGKQIYHPPTDNVVRRFTIPFNGIVPFPIGTTIMFINDSTVPLEISTIAGDNMVQVLTGFITQLSILAPYGMASVIKVDSTRWFISGPGVT